MKYIIEYEDANGKVRIETKHADSARKFIDALELVQRDERAVQSLPANLINQAE